MPVTDAWKQYTEFWKPVRAFEIGGIVVLGVCAIIVTVAVLYIAVRMAALR